MSNSKVYYDDISCIRAILIISIVIGHSFAIYTGGSAWPLPDGISSIYAYKYINPTAISFHLQGFVFIAGFLFGSQMSKGVPQLLPFMCKKTKRILLPMLVYGMLYIFLFNKDYFYSEQWIKCLCYGSGHLWFLPMLYLCYVFSRLFWNILKTPSIGVFVALTTISISTWLIPTAYNPGDFLFYFVFFIQGAWFFTLREKIYKQYNTRKILIALYILLVLLICIKCWAYYSIFPGKTPFMACIRYLLGVIGSVALMFTFNKIELRGISLSQYRWNGWYGVYIYHQFVLMILYYKISIVTNNSCLLPIISFFMTTTISVLISQISLKTKTGRFLIG